MTIGESEAAGGRREAAARAFRETGREISGQTLTLVADCVRDVVERHNFPPIYGHACWDPGAVEETVQEFCAAPGRTVQQRLTYIALQSVGEREFIAQLREAVANDIRSELRRSQRGRLAVTLRALLRETEEVVQSPKDFFALHGSVPDTEHVPVTSDLVAAARAVEDVKVIRWRPDATNHPPIAEHADLRRISLAVLAAAGVPVHLSTLIEVLAHRFELRDAPTIVGIDEVADSLAAPEAAATADPAARADALRMWNQMTVRDRQMFPLLAESARDIGAKLGVSKSAAAVLKTQLMETLRCALPTDPEEAHRKWHWIEAGRRSGDL
jgi:hypothetical protein